MVLPTKTDWVHSAAGAGLAAAIYTTLLAVRGDLGLEEWDRILVVALLAGAGILCALLLVRGRYQHALNKIVKHIDDYRHNPSSCPDRLQDIQPVGGPALKQLTQSLDSLCASYRQSLSDRVVQSAALDSLRALLGRVDLDKGMMNGLSFRGGTTSRDMVARFTPNLHWLTATPTLQQFLGCQMGDLNGRPFLEVVHPDDATTMQQAFQTALQTGEAHNIAFRVRVLLADEKKESGKSSRALARPFESRHIQADMLTRFSDLGLPLHVRCYLVDITDRVKAEVELRRRTEELSQTNGRLRQINLDLQRLKESYRDLYHNAPVIYFSLDTGGLFVTFNETMLTTLGYSREEINKQPYTRLLTPESQKRFLQDQDAFQKAGEVETRWVKKDGTVIDVWIRSTPLQDEAGRFIRSRSVAQDVTERNRLAGELRRRGDALERANAELLQINNSLDEFTAVVSHDLKEPLRTLESYSIFLHDEYAAQLGAEGSNYLDYLMRASRRLSNMIADLQALAQAGRITRELQTFDLAETVSTVRKDLDDLIRRKHAVVVTEGTLPSVVGDSPRINQMLSNLIANGIKYNTSAVPRIFIGVHAAGELNGHAEAATGSKNGESAFVTLYVSDNGIGIDPDYHEQIFAVFRRLHRADEYEGTGAGLAIAKKIVEAHGGHIWVESAPGAGSTFYFTLPRVNGSVRPQTGAVPRSARGTRHKHAGSVRRKVQTKAVSSSSAPASEPAVAAENGATPQILLVEDMVEIAMIVQKLASRAGYSIFWVASAEAAWEYLQQQKQLPELVLLDIHLPGMSGVDLCKMLRGTPPTKELVIALFSQLEQPEAQVAGRSAGANHVLSKDLLCKANSFQRKLDDILSAGKVRESV